MGLTTTSDQSSCWAAAIGARDELMPLVYEEHRRWAHKGHSRGVRATVANSALLNEPYFARR